MSKKFLAPVLFLSLISTAAVAVPNYTTSVTVPYDPNAGSFNGTGFQSASNNSQYTVRTGEDATNFYVDVTSTPNANTDTSLQFSNIYIGGPTFTNSLIFEVTNNRVSTTASPGDYHSLAGTGFSYSATTNDISFALPFAFLENNPLGLNYGQVSPGDLVRVSYSQSFGYSLVFGGYFDPVNRLGAQTVPASAVPEPVSLSLLGGGLFAAGLLRRRDQRRSGV